ncbi:MAG TPA: hypothetical protein VMW41_04260 [Candidatus Bathyarchaeia archaeon]|nr:hypothetical protein [Candidatus Bathyarchaeia archaeon]
MAKEPDRGLITVTERHPLSELLQFSSEAPATNQTLSLLRALDQGEIPELFQPYVHPLPDDRMSYFDPDRPFARFFHPQSLADILARLKEFNLAALLVGGAARNMALGREELTDLDLMMLSLDVQEPLLSTVDLIDRLRGALGFFSPGRFRDHLYGCLELPASPLYIALLRSTTTFNSPPTSAKVCCRQPGERGGYNWYSAWENMIADLAIVPDDAYYHPWVWASRQPTQDSLMCYLVPKPGREIPVRGYLIDFFGAIHSLGPEVLEITYGSLEALLPPGPRDWHWVLSATKAVIRGGKLAVLLNKQAPVELFDQASQIIATVAKSLPPVSAEQEAAVLVFLEQIEQTLGKIAQANWPATKELLLLESVSRLFPRLNLVLESKPNRQHSNGTYRDQLSREPLFQESPSEDPLRIFVKTCRDQYSRTIPAILTQDTAIKDILPSGDLKPWSQITRGEITHLNAMVRTTDRHFPFALPSLRSSISKIAPPLRIYLGAQGWPEKHLVAYLAGRFSQQLENLFTPFYRLGDFPGKIFYPLHRIRRVYRKQR